MRKKDTWVQYLPNNGELDMKLAILEKGEEEVGRRREQSQSNNPRMEGELGIGDKEG